jgi:branched-chain amino acid transport system permease protein
MATAGSFVDALVMKRNRLVGLVILAAVYLVPSGMSSFNLLKVDEILSFAMLVVGLNITIAVAGQGVIGLAAVYSFGGYCAVVITQSFIGMGLAGMCFVGMIGALVVGLLVAAPALRVGGFYLGLTTVFLATVIPLIATNWNVTGGQVGINLFTFLNFDPWLSGWGEYVVLLTMVVVASLFTGMLISSRLGRRFAVLRTSEDLTKSLGISTYRTKLLAVEIGAAFCGIGSGMYVYSQQFFSPGSASVTYVILALAAMVIGGGGTVWGPLIGTAIVFGVNTFISFSTYSGIVFGALLLAFVMFAPQGARDVLKLGPYISRLVKREPLRAPSRSEGAAVPTLGEVTAAAPVRPASTQPAASSGLVVSNIQKNFGGVKAVAGVDLTVQSGTVHGLIGSNGSGKTTLLNLVSGFYRLDGGDVRMDGELLSGQSTHAIATAGIARTFQTPKLIESGTVLDNVLVAVEQRLRANDVSAVLHVGASRRITREATERAHEALREVGLDEHAGEKAGGLSHGLRRLVEIARAFAYEPKYVLMDEPGAGLSVAEVEILRASVRRLAEKGVGVLLIEHNVPMVLEIADEITAMHEGTVLFHGSPDELRSNSQVADAFLGEAIRAEEEVLVSEGDAS